jgi:hypothetical protein
MNLALALNDNRGNVLHGAYEAVGPAVGDVSRAAEQNMIPQSPPPAILLHVSLGQPKVSQPHMTITVQQHVLRLQVAVHDAAFMQVCQCGNDLSGVQPRDILVKHTLSVAAAAAALLGFNLQ